MQPRPERTARLVMVPFDARESTSLAVRETIRQGAQHHPAMGRAIRHRAQNRGDWHISRVVLRIFLDGDLTTLAAYYAGNPRGRH